MPAESLLSAFNWYGFIIGTGMIACIVIAYFLSVKRGYYPDLVFDIVILGLPLAIVGARLYYVLFDVINGGHWTFTEILGFGKDGTKGLAGLAIYGGVIGALCGGLIAAALQKRRKEGQRVTFIQMVDLAFSVFLLGQAIGRWGNFANGEAYGTEVTNPAWQWFPFAVNIDGTYHLATFFYESMWNLAGFFLLLWFYAGKRKSFDGFVFSCYCIWYGLGRFFIEGLRTDSLWLIPNVVRVSQLLSALLFIFGIVYIIAHVYRARGKGLKPFVLVPIDKLDDSYFEFAKSQVGKPPMERTKRKKKRSVFEDEEQSDAPTEEPIDESAPDATPEEDSSDATAEEVTTDAPTEEDNTPTEDTAEETKESL